MSIFAVLCLIVFLQLLTMASQFTTLNRFGIELGADAAMVGWLWAAYAFPRAISGPLLSGWSDRIGRRPLMLMGGVATVAASLLWAMSTSFPMLLASRALDSLLSAQAILAFAIVADITPPERRAARMGLMGAMVSLAFILGPAMGAIVGARLGLPALGMVNAALQIVAVAITLVWLDETLPALKGMARLSAEALSVQARDTIAAPASVVGPSVWARVAVVGTLLVLTVGYTQFNTAFELSSAAWFGFGEKELTIGWIILGVTGALSQGGLLRVLSPRIGEAATAAIGAALATVGFAAMATGWSPAWLFGGTVVLGLGGAMGTAALTALLSRHTSDRRQGLVLGLGQTAQQLGRGAGPVLGAYAFATFGPAMPFVLAAIICGACVIATAAFAMWERARRAQPTDAMR